MDREPGIPHRPGEAEAPTGPYGTEPPPASPPYGAGTGEYPTAPFATGPHAIPAPFGTNAQGTGPYATGPQQTGPFTTNAQPLPTDAYGTTNPVPTDAFGAGTPQAAGAFGVHEPLAGNSFDTDAQAATGAFGTGARLTGDAFGTDTPAATGAFGTERQVPARVPGTDEQQARDPFGTGAQPMAAPYGTDTAETSSERYGATGEQATGPTGVRATSGVEVRLGTRSSRHRERRQKERAGRRNGFIAAGVLGLAALVAGGLLLLPGSGDGKDGPAVVAPSAGEGTSQGQPALPRRGAPITVGTADGSKYRIEAVTGRTSDNVASLQSSSPPSGGTFAYVEYVLSNPSSQKVLLDFPGDVFVKKNLVLAKGRGRCMPQAGVPEDMCTLPIKSEVVRRLAGGPLLAGDGGDQYMPPGASYLVRATVAVPVDEHLTRRDMGLYVWKQLYMADQLAKQAPFPR